MKFEVRDITKHYGQQPVLRGTTLSLKARRCLSILGPSGCGKSTLLKVLAGLETAEQGRILFDGQSLENVPARRRGLVYLSQEPLLFPYLNVFENISFGLRLKKRPAKEIRQRTLELIEALGLEGMGEKMPAALSGGQRQRVAFGRALIIHPRVLLLDEPFGALDAQTRSEMQKLFMRISSREGITSLFVTHDAREALVVGHQWAFMQEGHLRQYHTTAAFMADPATGLPQEMRFWQALQEEQKQNQDPM